MFWDNLRLRTTIAVYSLGKKHLIGAAKMQDGFGQATGVLGAGRAAGHLANLSIVLGGGFGTAATSGNSQPHPHAISGCPPGFLLAISYCNDAQRVHGIGLCETPQYKYGNNAITPAPREEIAPGLSRAVRNSQMTLRCVETAVKQCDCWHLHPAVSRGPARASFHASYVKPFRLCPYVPRADRWAAWTHAVLFQPKPAPARINGRGAVLPALILLLMLLFKTPLPRLPRTGGRCSRTFG
jgi:hypothetical protein